MTPDIINYQKQYRESHKEQRRLAQQRFREAHPEYNHNQHKQYRAKAIKRIADNRNLPVECERCHCDDSRCVEMNHINGGGRQDLMYRTHTYRDINNGTRTLDDLNLLCRPHNAVDYLERKYPELVGKFHISWDSGIETECNGPHPRG